MSMHIEYWHQTPEYGIADLAIEIESGLYKVWLGARVHSDCLRVGEFPIDGIEGFIQDGGTRSAVVIAEDPSQAIELGWYEVTQEHSEDKE